MQARQKKKAVPIGTTFSFLTRRTDLDIGVKQFDKLEFDIPYSNLIFPVFVFISHLPPIASPMGTLGISILPVFVRTINAILDGSLPRTLPVLVFTKISRAKQLFNETFPVPRLIEIFCVAVNLFNEMCPVFPFELKA